MQWRHHRQISQRDPIWRFVAAQEEAHTLLLGLLGRFERAGSLTPGELLASVEDQGTVVLVIMLAGGPLVLSDTIHLHAVDLAVRALWDEKVPIERVVGPSGVVGRFIEQWCLKGGTARLLVRERVFALRQVMPVQGVKGGMRAIEKEDLPLISRWAREFCQEALPEEPNALRCAQRLIDRRLQAPTDEAGLVVWEDERTIRAMAGYSSPTPTGIRVAPVYTPPTLRGQGYASALVAALSQWLLDIGFTHVTLFTDLANPTSNKIYRLVGYRPVVDVDMWGIGQELAGS